MPTEALQVIELPEQHVRVVLRGDETPLLRREGDTSYACGGCEAVLVEDAWQWEVRNVVLRCPSCGAHNEVRK